MRIALVLLAACGATPSPPTTTAPPAAPPARPIDAAPPDPPTVITAPSPCASDEECHHEAEDYEAEGTFDLAAVSYGRACAFGDGASCFAQGLVLRGNVEPADVAGSHDAFAKACDAGVADGCTQVGTDYLTGTGVAKDFAKARTILDGACAAGSGLACYNIGVGTRDGLYGRTKDLTAAYAMFEKGCTHDSAFACREQALALHDGVGTKRDGKRAIAFADRACAISVAECAYRAELHGDAKEYEKARALYDRACGAKSGVACYNLGMMLENGRGGGKDKHRATAAFSSACALGVTRACGRGECASESDACKNP